MTGLMEVLADIQDKQKSIMGHNKLDNCGFYIFR